MTVWGLLVTWLLSASVGALLVLVALRQVGTPSSDELDEHFATLPDLLDEAE